MVNLQTTYFLGPRAPPLSFFFFFLRTHLHLKKSTWDGSWTRERVYIYGHFLYIFTLQIRDIRCTFGFFFPFRSTRFILFYFFPRALQRLQLLCNIRYQLSQPIQNFTEADKNEFTLLTWTTQYPLLHPHSMRQTKDTYEIFPQFLGRLLNNFLRLVLKVLWVAKYR